jgi:hypothetical protein
MFMRCIRGVLDRLNGMPIEQRRRTGAMQSVGFLRILWCPA